MQLLPISQLRALSVEEQDKLAMQAVRIEKAAKDATTAHKQSFPAVGKLVCVIEERLNELKSDRNPDGTPKRRMIAANTSLNSYWESITKTKLNNHALSCSVAFGTFVRSELITEADYDKNTAQCLELAASISTAVGGDVSHEAVDRAAEELSDRSKDSAKHLREILESVKEPKAMTAEKAKEMLARIFAAGFLTTLVIPAIGAEIAHLVDPETAKSAFFGMDTAMAMFDSNVDEKGQQRFPEATMKLWMDELSEREKIAANGGNNPVQIVNGTTPAPAAAPAPAAPVAAAA